MLGRKADGLYWMFRYLERAENTVRLIETGQRIALTRLGSNESEWRSVLQTAGVLDGYEAEHDALTKDGAIDWMLRGKENRSAVSATIAAARQNARSVRTAITNEVWEATNEAYMIAGNLMARKVRERDLPTVLSAIRRHTALVRGATHGTMLRNDLYDFARIGTFIERADNTARILDVKYYVLLPSITSVGETLDNVQWESVLRSVAAYRGFRMAHISSTGPREIANFLILDRRMPRSLAFCVGKLCDNLGYLAADYDFKAPSLALAEEMEDTFKSQDIDGVFDLGLHEYIQWSIDALARLGRQIETDYRFYA
ncbi:MAG: alpha-E domain-containing protein [Roseovarius sp.]|nr:alpha-E domain-containing protein [Roseovarius sp.]MCY4208304.1 alpha-E domain-containing protein [Roseovarius sp.]MCY4291077.1 alpha-E domain-containing protein [Roseovarius sp.]MCY4316189.1 alpha-E domain-containing protein [Roseovarius sp.]